MSEARKERRGNDNQGILVAIRYSYFKDRLKVTRNVQKKSEIRK